MGKLRKITGGLEIAFKVTLSIWSPSSVGSQPTIGQFVYSYSKFRFLRKRGKTLVVQLSLLWYKKKSPLSDTFNNPANHGGQWSLSFAEKRKHDLCEHTLQRFSCRSRIYWSHAFKANVFPVWISFLYSCWERYPAKSNSREETQMEKQSHFT